MRVPTRITPSVQRTGGRSFVRNGGTAGAASQVELGNQLTSTANTLGTVGGLISEQAKQARRFGQLQNFSAFQSTVDQKFDELKRNADPAQGNFADQAMAEYNNMETDWLAQVPDEFHDEFKTRAADKKAAIARSALAFQYESTDAFFKRGVTDAIGQSLLSLDQDGSLANLDAQRAAVDEYINSSGLTEAEKLAQRRAAYTSLESVSYKSEVRRGNLEASALGVGSAPGRVVDLIASFEGPKLETGLTYEENTELLQSRAAEAEQIAVKGVGSIDRWAALPTRARAALISLTDDLGELPAEVKRAIDSGDLNEVANAVADAPGADTRRIAEAQTILGTRDMPEGQLDADPRFANVPYEDRLVLRADAEREAALEQSVLAAQQTAMQKQAVNQLMVDIMDGKAKQYEIDQAREAGILTDVDDIKKAQKLLDDGDATLRLVQEGQTKLSLGMTFSPGDETDKKRLNAMLGSAGQAALHTQNMDYVQSVLVPLVRDAGDMPTDAANLLTGMIRSQDPKKALFALDTLSQLEQASPEAYQARVTDAVAGDVTYWQSIKDYYPQDQVLASVRGGTTQEERTRTTMLREEAKKLVTAGEVDTNLTRQLAPPGWFQGDAIMAAGTDRVLNADYEGLFEREFARDGNKDAAQKRALTALGRIWKPTNIGGQTSLMRYPPELVGYPTWNGSYDWMTEQGKAELGIDRPFQLISDEQTKAEYQNWQGGEGAAPSYLAVYKDDEGNLVMPTVKQRGAGGEILGDTGRVQRIYFEITPEMEAAKADHVREESENIQYHSFMDNYAQAVRHSVNTGVPVPPELTEEYDKWVELKGEPFDFLFSSRGLGVK